MKTTQLKNHETEQFEFRQLPALGCAFPPVRDAWTGRTDKPERSRLDKILSSRQGGKSSSSGGRKLKQLL